MLLAATAVFMTARPAVGQARDETGWDLQLRAVKIVGQNDAIFDVMGWAEGPDGSVYLVEGSNRRILRYSPEGKLLWEAGRRGGGPGEYELPYRIAVSPDSTVLVYDRSRNSISRLSPDGSYRDRLQLEVNFSQIDNIVALRDGGIAVAGVTSQAGSARLGVHIFDSRMRHVRSFGPVPAVKDPYLVRQWGAGGLTLAANGDLLYVRRLPYEIYRYSSTGELKALLRPDLPVFGTPDQAFQVSREGNRIQTTVSQAKVTRPLPAHELPDGTLLSGRSVGVSKTWDFIRPDGSVIRTLAPRDEWHSVVGIDRKRGYLWLLGEHELEPVLLRASFVIKDEQ
jgi:hypothetical protein